MNKFINNIEVFLSSSLARLLPAEKKSNSDFQNPSRILIVKSCCFGDAVISLDAIKTYKKINPDCTIDILCSLRVNFVYESISETRNIYTLPLTGRNIFFELISPGFLVKCLSLFLRLRKNNYTELFDLELYRAYPVLLKKVLKIPTSRGFIVESAVKKNHETLVIREKDVPEWRCFYLLFGLENQVANPVKVIYPPKNHEAQNTGLKKIGIVFGSSFNWPQKKWPRQNFTRIMEQLKNSGYSFILFGAGHEIDEGQLLEKELTFPVENTVGQLDYNALIGKIHECTLVLGNDTGTLHLASACGVPSVTIFGPTNHLKWNGFLSTPVYTEIHCRPCYYLSHMPACSHINCLNQMEVDQVFRATQKMLNPGE